MRRALGLERKQFVAVDAARQKLPDPSPWRAIVIGGPVEDPVRGKEKPWMRRVYRFIREALRRGTPILGVCGGLQFTTRVLQGEIAYNPRGRDFGNTRVRLTRQGLRDPLFAGLPRTFVVSSSHKCILPIPLPRSRVLASSTMSPVEALAIGSRVRLLQFHPEMTLGNMRGLARLRKEPLIAEGFAWRERFPRLIAALRDTTRAGGRILRNFLILAGSIPSQKRRQ